MARFPGRPPCGRAGSDPLRTVVTEMPRQRQALKRLNLACRSNDGRAWADSDHAIYAATLGPEDIAFVRRVLARVADATGGGYHTSKKVSDAGIRMISLHHRGKE
jgi:hypothetical protein